MDIGFVNTDSTYNPDSVNSRYHWSPIHVVGPLKSYPTADIAWIAWVYLSRYAREVLAVQETCYFVLGFTLCGPHMRIWEFDRLGGIASERYIEIERDGQTERLIIDEVMKHAPCITGRATTYWKAHLEVDLQTPFAIKDSQHYTDRDEVGRLLREASEKGVDNVARYYHHETDTASNDCGMDY